MSLIYSTYIQSQRKNKLSFEASFLFCFSFNFFLQCKEMEMTQRSARRYYFDNLIWPWITLLKKIYVPPRALHVNQKYNTPGGGKIQNNITTHIALQWMHKLCSDLVATSNGFLVLDSILTSYVLDYHLIFFWQHSFERFLCCKNDTYYPL